VDFFGSRWLSSFIYATKLILTRIKNYIYKMDDTPPNKFIFEGNNDRVKLQW